MTLPTRSRILILLLGDIVILYAALIVTLILRYGPLWSTSWDIHFLPFSLVFVVWITVFYAAGLYDLSRLRNNFDFLKIVGLTFSINSLLAIALFYLLPFFGIAPRANLFLFLLLFLVAYVYWRRFFNARIGFAGTSVKVLVLGESGRTEELVHTIKNNPQLGFTINVWIKKQVMPDEARLIEEAVDRHEIDVIVVPHESKHDVKLAKSFYRLLTAGVVVYDLPSFYELVFRKVPLSDLEDTWFLEHVKAQRAFYDDLKRASEFVFALLLFILLSPLLFLISLLIKLTSRGPIIFKQTRIGYNNETFTLYKFRTMRRDAEKDGAKWATESDPRATFLGKILRYTHLDELPQLWNILRGELSFVGPRPERPEFVKVIEAQVPHYNIRHLVKPGITGWAQVNFRYGASVEDAYGKLQYDIYYLKNRSPILDLAIVVKTLKSFLVNQK